MTALCPRRRTLAPAEWPAWRRRLLVVIFGHGTMAGKAFDVALIVCIVASVVAVMLDSMNAVREVYGGWLSARSFFGVVDVLAILPTYLTCSCPAVNTSR